MPSSAKYATLNETIPFVPSPILGQFRSEYFNTYYGPGYFQPWYQCFCKDGCSDRKPNCGKCAPQQFCNHCDLNLSAYCDTWNYNGGLGWIN